MGWAGLLRADARFESNCTRNLSRAELSKHGTSRKSSACHAPPPCHSVSVTHPPAFSLNPRATPMPASTSTTEADHTKHRTSPAIVSNTCWSARANLRSHQAPYIVTLQNPKPLALIFVCAIARVSASCSRPQTTIVSPDQPKIASCCLFSSRRLRSRTHTRWRR